jgi:hypothetical protein
LAAKFKREIKRYLSAISALIQAPSLPSPTNYVDIDPDKKDVFEIPHCASISSGGQRADDAGALKQVMIDLFKAAGG